MADYKETLDYLFGKLPMYQRQGKTAYKKTLDNIFALCEHSGNPHKRFKSIHVAGTNGKGSVSHMLASVLQTAGYKTGLYTSPHLTDFRERIKINGEMIPEYELVNYVEENKDFFDKIKPSFFEMTVAAAFYYFAKREVDVAVIETGLGGRLDSTNIITPLLSIITNISFDHVQFLGNTLKDIAVEKAGIIKKGVPVVIGEYDEETSEIFIKRAEKLNSPIFFADKEYSCEYSLLSSDYKQILNVDKNGKPEYYNLKIDLNGVYQKKNVICVLKSIDVLSEKFNLHKEDVYKGLLHVTDNTGFRGRWQVLGYNPLIVADGGHNEAGLKEVVEQIKKIPYKTLHFIFGTVKDKDIESILSLLPKDAFYYFTKAEIPRAYDEKDLLKRALSSGLRGTSYDNVEKAFYEAKKNAAKEDFIFAGGSIFVIAEVLQIFDNNK
ncbi:MAG: bifunctional folylpolyglutamate synthase/dihydrofolate synthase [Chlorobi bacterium]|nr:bifunctional folylpolyglutamate synthase/dihydrofolate synthase [Chlorobiota bacterium]